MDQKIKLLFKNSEAMSARLALIEQAKKSIEVDFYYVCDDKSGVDVLKALLEKKISNPKVKIKISVDCWGSQDAPFSLIGQLRSAGIAIDYFNPTTILDGYRHNLRNHRKSFIVDDEFYLLGSRNIADYHFGRDEKFEFLDVEVLFQSDVRISVVKDDIESHKKIRHFPFVARELLMSAQKEILIESAHFIPPQEFVDILKYKKSKGVDVQVFTNSLESSLTEDFPSMCVSNLKKSELAKAGVEVFEIAVRRPNSGLGTHSKYAIVDGIKSFVGSYNWDSRSFYLNAEIGALIHDEASAQTLRAELLKRKDTYFRPYDFVTSESSQIANLKIPKKILYKSLQIISPYFENFL